MGANLVCALALKPGLGMVLSHVDGSVWESTADIYKAGISALKPTLLTPNAYMIGFYWVVLYILQGVSSFY